MTRLSLGLGLALLLCSACQRDNEENFGLGPRGEAAALLARLGDAASLRALLGPLSGQSERRLGAHTRQQRAQLAIEGGGREEQLDEEWRTELDASGRLHATHHTSRDEGIEWYAAEGSLWVRPWGGRYVARRALGGELERLEAEQAGVLGGYLDVLGRFAERQASEVTASGKKARRVRLTLAEQPERLTDDDPAHAWRASLRAAALDGEVILDAATGAVLQARLDARYRVARPSGALAVTLGYRSQTQLGAAAVTPPVEAVSGDPGRPPPPRRADALARPRPHLDRAALLEGLLQGQEKRK